MIASPRQRDIEKMIRAVRAAGVEVGCVECSTDGTIRILAPGAGRHDDDADKIFNQWQAGQSTGRP